MTFTGGCQNLADTVNEPRRRREPTGLSSAYGQRRPWLWESGLSRPESEISKQKLPYKVVKL